MTETVSKNFQQWVGDGVTDIYTLSNVTLLDETHLAVYLDDAIQTIIADYSVGIEAQIATVTFLTPPVVGQRISIVREEPLEQNTDLTTINTFRAEGFEGALDAIVRQIYRLWHRLSRSLTLPDSALDGDGLFDARSNRIGNVADPIAEQDAITKAFADGTYALQSAAGGDMFKATYDTDGDGKVNDAVTAEIAPWSGLTGIPASFTPAAHTHTVTDVDDFYTAADARIANSAQDVSNWETGTGTTEGVVSPAKIAAAIATIASGGGDMIKATYDSNNNGKVDAADAADVAPWSGLTGLPTTFTPSSHTHAISDVTDFNTSADARISAAVGVSVQAYQAAQLEATWENGTETTASVVSPAHVKVAIDALGSGGPSAWTEVADGAALGSVATHDITGFATYTDIDIHWFSVEAGANNEKLSFLLSDDDGLTFETAGYIGRESAFGTLYDGGAWDNGSTLRHFRLRLRKLPSKLLIWDGGMDAVAGFFGAFDNGNEVNAVRLYTTSTTAVVTGGTYYVRAR